MNQKSTLQSPNRLEPELDQGIEQPVCVVTGSSRGIGRHIACALGDSGAKVVVNYRTSDEKARKVVHEVCSRGGDALSFQADVSDLDQVDRMNTFVHSEWGAVDVLVTNAGITVDKTFENMSREDWDRVLNVNLGGTFNCTRCFFQDLAQSTRGRLITISSVVGQQGNYGQANYATSKSGIFGFTRTLAQELAPYGSTANCIAPGFTTTDMLEDVREGILQRIRDKIPLQRFARPEEIAHLVRFLASEYSSYITGQVIGINGGMVV